MTFVTAGLAIAGLVGMAIPILIHLLWRQRRRPVRWGAMRFLIEAYRRHRRRLQLEQLLLLALRCLLVALLGLALARPVLQASGVLDLGGARSVYLVIDDGLASSVARDDVETAFARHVAEARTIIEALDPGDFVGLISAARPARALVVPPSSDHGGVLDLLESLEPRQSPTDLHGAFTALRGALEEATAERQSTFVYLLSDLRSGSAPLERPLPTVLAEPNPDVALFAAGPDQELLPNTQIVAVEPVRSVVLPGAVDGSGQVTVRLSRHGGQLDREVSRVRLEGPDLGRVEPRIVQWPRGQAEAEVEFALDVPVGGDRQVSLTAAIDDDRLNADNRRFTVLEARERIRILLVDRRSFGFEPGIERLAPGQWLRKALEPADEGVMEVVEVEPAAMDITDLRRTDVAILPRPDLVTDNGWRLLRDFVDAGGMLIVTPPSEAGLHQWADRMTTALDLPWRIGIEAEARPEGLALDDDQPAAGLLRMISSEMETLAGPIVAERVLPVDEAQTRGQRVLRFADGTTMMLAGAPELRPEEPVEEAPPPSDTGPGGEAPLPTSRGLVVYCAVAPDLSWTNLPSKPLMVPLWHELIRQGLSLIRSSHRVAVGEAGPLGLPPATRMLVDPDGERVPVDREGRPQRPLDRGGLWTALDAAGQRLGVLPVNVDPAAARLTTQSEAAVTAWLEASGPWSVQPADELAGSLGAVDAGSPLWRALLLALLAVVLLETLLARWFSHASRSTADDSSLLEETGRLSLGASR
jgi:hypothetical protein